MSIIPTGPARTGILLIQLGTPDEPTPPALKRYLRQFLGDPRVIEVPRLPWWFILNLLILPTRPKQSAAKYRRIWDPQTGSPLLHYTKLQTAALQQAFPDLPVRFGMQIGNPSLESVVHQLIEEGIERLLVLPMYPQYSATTTASAYDMLFTALKKERRVPTLRVVPPYYEHPAYLDAVAAVVRDELARLPWKPDHYLISFHGLPIKYAQKGDPYPTHVVRTTRQLVDRLGWRRQDWTQSYQSLFGKDPWLRPYTEETLQRLAKRGLRKVFVVTPGFTADCLETIDEIGNEAKETFLHAGGELLFQCPCLNAHPAWIKAMETILREEGQGWLQGTTG